MKKGLMEVKGISYGFAGFYESIFTREDAFDFEEAPEAVQKFFNNGYIWDYVKQAEYRNNVGEEWIKCILPNDFKVKEVEIVSPPYHNFETDKVKYTVELPKRFEEIVNEVKNHPFFAELLRRSFTPYDGFIPFYSNNVEQFINTMNERETPYEVEVGAILFAYSLIKYAENGETFDEVLEGLLEYAEETACFNDEEFYFDTEKFVKDISKQMNVKGECENWESVLWSTYDSDTNTLTFN